MSTFFSADLFAHLAATLEVDEAAVIAAFNSFAPAAGKTKSTKAAPKGKAPAKGKAKAKKAPVEAEDSDAEPDLAKMTVAQLKEMCKAKELEVSGTKAVLIARLKGEGSDAEAEEKPKGKAKGKKAAAPKAKGKAKKPVAKKEKDEEEAEADDAGAENYDDMTVAELKEKLGELGLTKSGKKDELIARLQEAAAKGGDEDVEVEEEAGDAVAEEDAGEDVEEVEGDEE